MPWVAEAGFVALLLLVFVGLSPFEVRDATTLVAGTGAGNIARQISYLAVFAVILASALDRRGLASATAVPVSLVVLLIWCLLSASWAGQPAIAVRRAGLEFVVVLSTMLSIGTVGPERALRLWRYVLAGVLIVNWISIAVVPQAVHLAGEADPSLVGDWRGLYFHKNIAGAVTAISAMVFLYYAVSMRSRIDAALFVAALGFLVMTGSKSSMGFLPAALLLGAVYRWGWRRDLDRLIVTLTAGFAIVVVTAFAATHADQIARLLQNPAEFTGRTAIWQAELDFVRDHTWLGAGYGTFADTGGNSPLFHYIDAKWIATVSHGHNGYLQLMVTIGVIGFALAMLALVVMPLAGFWPRDPDNLPLKALLFAIFVFVVLHNLLESDYLESDGPTWVAFLIMIAMMRTMRPRVLARRAGGAS
jgi:O-antigen ligase